MRSTIWAVGLALATATAACQASPESETKTAAVSAETAAPASTMAPVPEPEAKIPEGPEMKADRVEVSETPCRTAIGETAAARLVERCIAVSPATRPPCNAANPCDLIQGEIDRSCNQYGPGETRPKECLG